MKKSMNDEKNCKNFNPTFLNVSELWNKKWNDRSNQEEKIGAALKHITGNIGWKSENKKIKGKTSRWKDNILEKSWKLSCILWNSYIW